MIHELPFQEETVHGYFSSALPPVLALDPGDSVRFQSLNARWHWDAERRLQAGYVPADVAPELRGDEQAVSLWEFRDEAGSRIGLRVLLAPADAWIQEPRA